MAGFRYLILAIIITGMVSTLIAENSSVSSMRTTEILFRTSKSILDYISKSEDDLISREFKRGLAIIKVTIDRKSEELEEKDLGVISLNFKENSIGFDGVDKLSCISIDGNNYRTPIPYLIKSSYKRGSITDLDKYLYLDDLLLGKLKVKDSESQYFKDNFILVQLPLKYPNVLNLSEGVYYPDYSKDVLPNNQENLFIFVLKDLKARKFYTLNEFKLTKVAEDKILIDNILVDLKGRSLEFFKPKNSRVSIKELQIIWEKEEVFEDSVISVLESFKFSSGKLEIPSNVVNIELKLKGIEIPEINGISVKIKKRG